MRKQQNGKDQSSLQEIRDSKGTFHAKMGTIKDRNGMGLTEADDIKQKEKAKEKKKDTPI